MVIQMRWRQLRCPFMARVRRLWTINIRAESRIRTRKVGYAANANIAGLRSKQDGTGDVTSQHTENADASDCGSTEHERSTHPKYVSHPAPKYCTNASLNRYCEAYLTFCHLLLPLEFVYCSLFSQSKILQGLSIAYLLGVHLQWMARSWMLSRRGQKEASYFRGSGQGACTMDEFGASVPKVLSDCPGFDVFMLVASLVLLICAALRTAEMIEYPWEKA